MATSDFTPRRADEPAMPRADAPVQEFPRRDGRLYRRGQPEGGDRRFTPDSPAADNMLTQATSVVQRAAVNSVGELDKLIAELEALRDFLRQEGIRIQREVDGYARLSEEATKSTRIIADSVAQWKSTLGNIGRRP